MIVQFSKVTFSQYQARYSPFTTLLRTVTFFRVPEGVFRVKGAVFKNRIFNVLERILPLHAHIRKAQVGRAHHEVFAFGVAILHLDPPDRPAELRGNNVAATHFYIAAFPQGLDAVKPGVFNGNMAGIPQGRPASLRHLRITNGKAVVVPERVAAG